MRKEILYSLKAPYRDDLKVTGYRFGYGEKTACIVGALRGNEIQQLYVCSLLVQKLKDLEAHGHITQNNEILIIPSVNHYAMNIGKRFWAVDNTDINRKFPGIADGGTTERIAAGVFECIKGYSYGIQFASFYMPGQFIPHVRMMETEHSSASLANLFGLPYVVLRKPRPYDTTTLNYNWQNNGTNAFFVYTNDTDNIDEESAQMAVSAVLRFLTRMGVLKYNCHGGYIASVIHEDELTEIHTEKSGIFRSLIKPGDEVSHGQPMALILDPYEGSVRETIASPTDGVVFFQHLKPLVNQCDLVFEIIRRLHV